MSLIVTLFLLRSVQLNSRCHSFVIKTFALLMQGYLPVAYGYGFAALEDAEQLHGWVSLQLLGWSVHDVVNHSAGLKTWSKFYQVFDVL